MDLRTALQHLPVQLAPYWEVMIWYRSYTFCAHVYAMGKLLAMAEEEEQAGQPALCFVFSLKNQRKEEKKS